MRKAVFLFTICLFSILGHSQNPTKRIDSIVKLINSEKSLKVKMVCDTSFVSYSDLSTIECLKFYFQKDKLLKAIYSLDYRRKDSTLNNSSSRFDEFYYNDGQLIKVITKDFDQSPPKNIEFYLNENQLKKFLSKETPNPKGTQNYSRYDGINYFIESAYTLLNEFKLLNQKVNPK